MKNIHRVTYALLGLVFITAVLSVVITSGGERAAAIEPAQQPSATQALQKHREMTATYPTVDYDQAKPSDLRQDSEKERQKRHNKGGLVRRIPHPNDAEIDVMSENAFDFPALPVDKSDVIVLAEVLTAEAHLSEDKSNVYSDFSIRVDKTIKQTKPDIPLQGSLVTVERIGGFVRYPGGQTVLYRQAGFGMPRIGASYVLFLNSIPQSQDYTIVTAYELGDKGVVPLDLSQQFDKFRGVPPATFLKTLADSLTNSGTH